MKVTKPKKEKYADLLDLVEKLLILRQVYGVHTIAIEDIVITGHEIPEDSERDKKAFTSRH